MLGKKQATLQKLTPIAYFKKHGINIKKIYVNPSAYGSFFISKDNKLYACGDNTDGMLGTAWKARVIYQPTLVTDLENKFIIDIKSCNMFRK